MFVSLAIALTFLVGSIPGATEYSGRDDVSDSGETESLFGSREDLAPRMSVGLIHPDALCALQFKICDSGHTSWKCNPSDCTGLPGSLTCKLVSIPSTADPDKKIYWCECATGGEPGSGIPADCTLVFDHGSFLLWCAPHHPFCSSQLCALQWADVATCRNYFCVCNSP